MNGVVAIERSGEVAILRLNRPEAMNAVNEEIRRELPAALAALDDVLAAAKKYQKRAYESGEPQRRMREFLEVRKKP